MFIDTGNTLSLSSMVKCNFVSITFSMFFFFKKFSGAKLFSRASTEELDVKLIFRTDFHILDGQT